MKRKLMILAGLLLMITSLVYSNNLDKYESKRVFDKNIEVLLTGNYDKYKDDPEMVRALGGIDKKSEAMRRQSLIGSLLKSAQLK